MCGNGKHGGIAAGGKMETMAGEKQVKKRSRGTEGSGGIGNHFYERWQVVKVDCWSEEEMWEWNCEW